MNEKTTHPPPDVNAQKNLSELSGKRPACTQLFF